MKFIRTESHELINAANIITFEIVEGEGTNENNEVKTMYGIVATDILGKEHDVVLFDNAEKALAALEDIQDWLEIGKFNVYKAEGNDGK